MVAKLESFTHRGTSDSSCLSANPLPARCWLWPSKTSHLSTLAPNQGLERVAEEIPWWTSNEDLPSNAGGLGSILGQEGRLVAKDPTCLVAKKTKHKTEAVL